MTLQDFKRIMQESDPVTLAENHIFSSTVYAFQNSAIYSSYLSSIKNDYPQSTDILVVGSANWGFSLNPKKNFRVFGNHSDIDIAIISTEYYQAVWDALRDYHRRFFYKIPYQDKMIMRRNGENIYCGFVSPKWMLDLKSDIRISYEINTNKYSNDMVGYKKVNMMFFKNRIELIDYYVRGFRLAKSRV